MRRGRPKALVRPPVVRVRDGVIGRYRRMFCVGVLAIVVLWPVGIRGQTAATVSTLKAAFLYNFAKFTVWPPDALAAGQRLSLCVIGDSAVADALEQTIKGHVADGHELTVQILKPDGPIRSCHLLYVTGLDWKRATQMFDTLKGVSVLTVSDGDSLGEAGFVARLILQGDRMLFAINVAAAERARLQMSSRLLSLATIVRERTRDSN